MTSDELRWQTEDDARVLKAYATLRKDAARLAAAKQLIEHELDTAAEAIGLSTPKQLI